MMKLLIICIIISWFAASYAGVIPWLKPNDQAPSFSLQTEKNLLTFKKGQHTDLNGPVVVLAYTNESAFLENMFNDITQFVFDLAEYSPDNAQYVIMFHDDAAFYTRSGVKDNYHVLKEKLYFGLIQYTNKKWKRYMSDYRRLQPMANYKQKGSLLPGQYVRQWFERLHFVRFPVHQLGNWIPRVLSQWHCYNPFCGFDQIAIENQQGDVHAVIRRLDARYTWLPPFKFLASTNRHVSRFMLVSVNNACAPIFNDDVRGRLALVHMNFGKCSAFTKIKNAQENGALGVIFYSKDVSPELDCHGRECEIYLSIPACIVHHVPSFFMGPTLPGSTYIRFQTTPSGTYTFGIDSQGRVQKTDWFLYPSIRFAAYHAQWFNYVDNFIKNTTGDAKVLSIFKDRLLSTVDGTSTVVALPPYKELVVYQNVEVEMSLKCPSTGACTCWDHVIRLFVSCDDTDKSFYELARWIAGYKRRSTSWITPVRSILPLLKTNSTCRFSLITEDSVLPWIVTVNLRLSDKIKSMPFNTWKQIEKELIPVQIKSLFTGCFFDENCNKKYSPVSLVIPSNIARVKLVATITGHGNDNNHCAGSCLTTHRFVINSNSSSSKTKIYRNSESALGCKVDLASETPKSKWMRGRESFCDGQEVVPWQVDISEYIKFGKTTNTIQYRALFNGTDSKPTQNPGRIFMSSYVVYYTYETLVNQTSKV